jgi:hypothetical protein
MRLGVMSKLVGRRDAGMARLDDHGRDQASVDELLQDVEMDQVCVSDLIRSCCIVPSHLAAWHEDVESDSC